MLEIKKWKLTAVSGFLFLSLVLTGLFYVHWALLTIPILSCLLFVKEKNLRIRLNWMSFLAAGLCLCSAISMAAAVDRGTAWIGFLKTIPILLFALLLMQHRGLSQKLLDFLPCCCAVLAALSMLGSGIPVLQSYLLVAGRLAGPLQYPNTFAMLLLLGELLLLTKEKLGWKEWVCLTILLAGLIYTGSRTVFVLGLFSNLAMGFFSRNRKWKVGILAGTGGALVLIAGAALITGSPLLSRFLHILGRESTFLGRFLYWQDAIPAILSHPLGLGYMGYYYIEPTIQTGQYSVMFLHNDVLQLAADYGWLALLLFAGACLHTLRAKNTCVRKKIVFLTFLLHICFDFDLQFTAMFFLFFLFLDGEEGREILLKKKAVSAAAAVGISAAALYTACAMFLFTVPSSLAQKTAYQLYPWYTPANEKILTVIRDKNQLREMAEHIRAQNRFVILPQSVSARLEFSAGNIYGMMDIKRSILENYPFQYEEYVEYSQLLVYSYSLFLQAQDMESADICLRELYWVSDQLAGLPERMSRLGRSIADQPITVLPQDILTFMESAGRGY